MEMARKISRAEAVVISVLFAAAITLPFGKQMLYGEADTSSIEGRLLNPLPNSPFRKLSRWKRPKTLKALGEYPAQFERYYSDHFGFRGALLRLGSVIKVKCLHMSPNRDVVLGKDGWLFLRYRGVHDGSPKLTDSDLERWTAALERRQEWLAKRGIQYLNVIAPEKESIYPEFLPDNDPHLRNPRPLDQLAQYVSLHSGVHFLSLRESLLAAKGDERLYFRQDTHWNSLGAFVGYQTIINGLRQWFPNLKPRIRSEFPTSMKKTKGDLARMIGLPDFSSRSEPALDSTLPSTTARTSFSLPGVPQNRGIEPFTLENPNALGGPRAVLLRDSFSTALVPYFSTHFSRLTVIWRFDQRFEDRLADFIREEKPDVFIEEIVERTLSYRPPDPRFVFGGAED